MLLLVLVLLNTIAVFLPLNSIELLSLYHHAILKDIRFLLYLAFLLYSLNKVVELM